MRRLLLSLAVLLALTASAAAADMKPFVRGSWAVLRAGHQGRPLVVHFWGLTCGPCLVELPHWASLQRERPDLNLVLVGADPVPEEPADLARFLDKMGLSAAESWAFADRFVDRLQYEIDPRWRGELPRTMLIAADGKVTTITGVSEPADIRAWLDRQRAAPGG